MAARMEAPVAKPSSMRKMVRSFMGAGGAAAAKYLGAAGQFLVLLTRDLLDSVFAQPLLFDDFLVYDLDTAFGDGAEGQFGLAGHAEFANQPDIEGRFEGAGNLTGDGDSAAQEAEDKRVDSLQLL